MARRTQITLEEDQYARLTALSRQSGLSMAELVRRAVDRTYAGRGSALQSSFGAWRGRSQDGEAYVSGLRRGLARRSESGDRRAR
ncbi:MAG: ribbon-helix-helix domain-containing protein [Actinobacteria bacterium]|nr:ribbon-helix-helix domain-containing protein [Actinomycetota bacterium]